MTRIANFDMAAQSSAAFWSVRKSWLLRPPSSTWRTSSTRSRDEILRDFDEQSRYVMPTAHWSSPVNDPAVQKELWLALTAAINDLPADYRTVLLLRDVEGWSTREIAERLGVHIPAVKTRAYRARLFLRKQLSDALATLDATTSPKYKGGG